MRVFLLTLALVSAVVDGKFTIIDYIAKNLKNVVEAIEKNRNEFEFHDKCDHGHPKVTVHVTGGATYIRWGRTVCPQNGTEMVYAGHTAGAQHEDNRGSAANYLCLPKQPDWLKYKDGFQGRSERIFGTEYEVHQHSADVISSSIGEYDVPCAVCHSNMRATSFMFPGKTSCYNGWHLEYKGYLMAQFREFSPSEYICVDADPEAVGAKTNQNGRLLYPVEAACGVLPCPPYANGREMTCVVCTK